jgi:uncharacterized protein (TIGR02466 family)
MARPCCHGTATKISQEKTKITKTMQNDDTLHPVPIEAQPIGLFETPIVYCRLKQADELIPALTGAIRKRRQQTSGVQRSNHGGWHSESDMLDWGGAAAARLAHTAIALCKRMSHFEESTPGAFDWRVRMWANVTSPGGLNQLHAHPGNLWAAVLYLDMGEPEPGSGDNESEGGNHGGNFYVEDPRFPMAAMHNTGFRLKGLDGQPQQYQTELKVARGNLLVFPAWLRHGVRPYTGNRERISIAMNIDATPKSYPQGTG